MAFKVGRDSSTHVILMSKIVPSVCDPNASFCRECTDFILLDFASEFPKVLGTLLTRN